jgi:hypothetical protein
MMSERTAGTMPAENIKNVNSVISIHEIIRNSSVFIYIKKYMKQK